MGNGRWADYYWSDSHFIISGGLVMTSFNQRLMAIGEKVWHKPLVNYILAKRFCPKCAKKEWKNEDKKQRCNVLLGICAKCKRPSFVAYIEK